MISTSGQHASLQQIDEMPGSIGTGTARRLYTDVFNAFDSTAHGHASAATREARDYLNEQLEFAKRRTADLPAMDSLPNHYRWVNDSTAHTCLEYRHYLAQRRSGTARRYFHNRAHALYFLKSVAPTKLVDGSWLYGMLRHWRDPCFTHLIQIYLEELGEGVAEYNHVLIYKKLLSGNGCDHWQPLSDPHYVQGAIQLCLATQADAFLPELIGFNLGYEQLPLHLLICTHELEELGIDPWYFRLHITVDNAHSGHAWKSLQALHDLLPRGSAAEPFYRRVRNGYCLNQLGMGSTATIAAFDMDEQLRCTLESKSTLGRLLHSDHCRIGGRTVNNWLGKPENIPAFLDVLQREGWIRRHQPAADSPFWRLIQGDRAPMFGVFDAYEQQLIHDWIEGDLATAACPADADGITLRGRPLPQRHLDFGTRRRAAGFDYSIGASRQSPPPPPAAGSAEAQARHEGIDASRELSQLEQQLAGLSDREEIMARLIDRMSPGRHWTPAGLMATRIFTRLMC